MHRAYDEREAGLGSEVMRELERRVLLSVLDRKWREHLYEMDYLRAGIHLRAMANRDPVVEYQREGYDMFNAMLDGIKEESVGFLFNLEVKTKEEQEAEAKAKQDEAEAAALAAAQEGTARVLARQAAEAEAAAQAPAKAAPRRPPRGRRPAAAAAPAVEAPKPSGTGPQLAVKGLDGPRRTENLQYSAPTLDGSPKDGGTAKAAKTATVTGSKEPSRNAPCPCGSGKKYKFCHGAAEQLRPPVLTTAPPPIRSAGALSSLGSADLECGALPAAVDALEPGGHRVRPPVPPGDRADLGDAVDRFGHVHPPDQQRGRAARAPAGPPAGRERGEDAG